MDAGLAFKEFLEFVVGRLVRHPEAASVTHVLQGRKHVYQVRLSRDDMGRIIGRKWLYDQRDPEPFECSGGEASHSSDAPAGRARVVKFHILCAIRRRILHILVDC